MKKYLLVLVGILCLAPGVQAQRAKQARNLRQAFFEQPGKVSAQLRQRARNSYVQASRLESQLEQQAPGALTGAPREAALLMVKKIPLQDTPALYPDMVPFLSTDKQLSNYFLARNNREILKNVQAKHQRYITLQAKMDLLRANQVQTHHPAQEDMVWLMKQITPDIQTVVLGEQHGTLQIQGAIKSFLRNLRLRFPEREIILFEEFFPDWESFGTKEFHDLWNPFITEEYLEEGNYALSKNITVVGLDPVVKFLAEGKALVHAGRGAYLTESMWTMPEGMRLRNAHWQEVLKQYRAEHPQALFVVHCGFGHAGYTEPYSIGQFLKTQEKTYLVSLFPGFHPGNPPFKALRNLLKQESWFDAEALAPQDYYPASYFDMTTQGAFPQRIVQFKDENGNNFSDLTGFDVQIKIDTK